MNKHELIGKVLRKHYYVLHMLAQSTLSSKELMIFLDIIDSECDRRDIK